MQIRGYSKYSKKNSHHFACFLSVKAQSTKNSLCYVQDVCEMALLYVYTQRKPSLREHASTE